MEVLAPFLSSLLTIVIVLVTTLWVERAGLLTMDESDANTWWGRPIQRADYEPSGINPGFLLILVVFIVAILLSTFLVDAFLYWVSIIF
jgi:hypothetical protein